jgi:hypothetical protein
MSKATWVVINAPFILCQFHGNVNVLGAHPGAVATAVGAVARTEAEFAETVALRIGAGDFDASELRLRVVIPDAGTELRIPTEDADTAVPCTREEDAVDADTRGILTPADTASDTARSAIFFRRLIHAKEDNLQLLLRGGIVPAATSHATFK